MSLNMENIFSVQSWEYLLPDYLVKLAGGGSGTFAEMDKMGMAQVTAVDSQTISAGTSWTDLANMSISATIEAGQAVMINFSSYTFPSTSDNFNTYVGLRLVKDGAAIQATEKYSSTTLWDAPGNSIFSNVSINYIDLNVTAGIHTYKVQWNCTGSGVAACAYRLINAIKIKPKDE